MLTIILLSIIVFCIVFIIYLAVQLHNEGIKVIMLRRQYDILVSEKSTLKQMIKIPPYEKFEATAVANYLIVLSISQNKPLTPMKLHRLVYYAHGWHLAVTKRPLINECVEAWDFGPVIPSLYHALKPYGNEEITEKVVNTYIPSMHCQPKDFTTFNEFIQSKAIVDRVWDVLSDYTAIQLSNMSHEPGTPWELTRKKFNCSVPIKDQLIQEYFKNQANQFSSEERNKLDKDWNSTKNLVVGDLEL